MRLVNLLGVTTIIMDECVASGLPLEASLINHNGTTNYSYLAPYRWPK